MPGLVANTVSSSLWEAAAGVCEFKAFTGPHRKFQVSQDYVVGPCLKQTKDEILKCVRLLHVRATERLAILIPDGFRRSRPTVD